jgi:hypothetical protein
MVVRPGEIVQLSPDCKNRMFAGCFMVVTEPKPWGAQGYIQMTGEHGLPGGQAYYRATFEEMFVVGKAHWMVVD